MNHIYRALLKIFYFSIFLEIVFFQPSKVLAACPGTAPFWQVVCNDCDGTTSDDCIVTGGNYCSCRPGYQDTNSGGPFGSIKNPLSWGSNLPPGGGLIMLLNNVLRIFFVVAGIYTFIKIMLAGFKFITAGANPEKMSEAQNSIWQSLIGLIIVLSSIAVAALIGQVMFGNWQAILNPRIYGPNN